MIAKLCVAAVVLFAAALPAHAGGYYYNNCNSGCYNNYYRYQNEQCGRSSWHSLNSSVGWTSSCYRCHKQSGSGAAGDDTSLAEQAILRIAEKRDQWEATARRLQQRQSNLLGLIDKLGLDGNFRMEAYGAAGHYGVFPQSYYVPNAQQGSTVYQGQGAYGAYGGAQQPLTQSYEPIQLNGLVNALSRAPGDALKFADLAHQRTVQLSSDLTGEAQEANRILAMRDLLQVARAPAQTQRQTYQLSIQENGQPVVQTMPQAPVAPITTPLNPQMVLSTRCVACHNGPNANKVNLSDWNALSDDQVKAVMTRIVSSDPELRMPKNPDGSPGTPLSLPELQAMFCDQKVGAITYQLRSAPIQAHQPAAAPVQAGPQVPVYQK